MTHIKPKPLDKTDPTPLYAQLSASLIEYIELNNLGPGDPMPSQSELEKHFDVSQMTIRLALQRLASEDRITRIQGRGTFVAPNKLSLAPETIVPFEEQMLNNGIHVENELLEEVLVHPIERHRLELKLPEGAQTYKIRRLKRVDGEPICMEVNHMPPDFKGRFTKDELALPFLRIFAKSHETAVITVDYTIKSVLLLQFEADFLGVPADTPALVKHRVMYSNSGPVLAGRLVYLANKIEVRFTASQSSPIILTSMTTGKS